ncbi:MAG: hypothetical protein ABIJ45_09065, partial [Candidatus Zixiibacteriota bacterium]
MANVRIITFYEKDSKLYTTGVFEYIDTVKFDHIGIFDGISWQPIPGGGTLGAANTMQIYNNELYVGGGFIKAGGVSNTAYLASWDGLNWHPVSSGVSNEVYAFEIYDNKLFVGGAFGMAGGLFCERIAAWDGTNWMNVGSLNTVKDLKVYNGELYAVGGWTSVKKHTGGTGWVDVGGHSNWYLENMLVDTINNFLFVCGQNCIIDDTILCDGVAYYDGFNWHGLLGGTVAVYGGFLRMAIYQGDLYASSSEDTVDGYIARWDWDNNRWDSLGSGLNMKAAALTVYNDELYVGGLFSMAGGDTAYGLARWYMPTDTTCKYLQPRVLTIADTFYMSQGEAQVQFYNNNAYVQTWDWDFGDGNTANIKDPLHTYTE